MKTFCTWIFGLLVVMTADASEPARFVYEGEVVQVEGPYQEFIHLYEVLSGTLCWMPGTAGVVNKAGSTTFTQALLEAEFTLDKHFVMHFAGSLGAYNNYVILSDAERGTGVDIVRIYMPLVLSESPDSAFRIILLDIVLRDSEGQMLNGLGLPSEAPDFENAWFTLSALSDSNEWTTMAQGRITLFTRLEGPVQFDPDMDDLKGMVRALDEALAERDVLITELEAQLAGASARIAALSEKVTLLEQALTEAAGTAQAAELEKHNAVLREQLRAASAQQVATADVIAKLKHSEASLSQRSRSLEAEVRTLRQQLTEAVAAQAVAASPVTLPPMFARADATTPPAFVNFPEPSEPTVTEYVEPNTVPVVMPPFEAPSAAPEATEEPEPPAVLRRGPRR